MKRIATKNQLMKRIETNQGEVMEEILRRLFVDEHKTQKQIASELHISYLTVIRWLHKAGIRSRRIKLGD
jgi:DNA-binding transcriptional regulator LsrR (DeoR family)